MSLWLPGRAAVQHLVPSAKLRPRSSGSAELIGNRASSISKVSDDPRVRILKISLRPSKPNMNFLSPENIEASLRKQKNTLPSMMEQMFRYKST